MAKQAFLQKTEELKALFSACRSDQEKYSAIIDLGKKLPPYDEKWKTKEALVSGCQSTLYLHREIIEGKLFFFAYSEALISAGLAFLLIKLYESAPFEVILNHPPVFFEEIGLFGLLSPSRSNGFASLYKKMKSYALIALLEEKSNLSSQIPVANDGHL